VLLPASIAGEPDCKRKSSFAASPYNGLAKILPVPVNVLLIMLYVTLIFPDPNITCPSPGFESIPSPLTIILLTAENSAPLFVISTGVFNEKLQLIQVAAVGISLPG